MKAVLPLVALILICSLLTGCVGFGANRQPSPTEAALIASETEYLLSTQLPNGALAMYPAREGDNAVNPYFAAYSALALLRAGQIEPVRRYLDWHLEHLNGAGDDLNGLAGTIYDYHVSVAQGLVTGETTSTHYDSSDSYAALLLMLLEEYRAASGETEYLSARYGQIAQVARVLTGTASEGLTLAKPDHQVYYLMDNCEVLAALGPARSLLSAMQRQLDGDEAADCRALRKQLKSLEKAMGKAIERRLWDKEGGHYYSYLMPSGQLSGYDAQRLYPDGICQVCPVIFGQLSPRGSRAKALYGEFCENYAWSTLELSEEQGGGFAWGMTAYCAAVMGDGERLAAYLDRYLTEIAPDHAYPLYNADAAWVLMACLYR